MLLRLGGGNDGNDWCIDYHLKVDSRDGRYFPFSLFGVWWIVSVWIDYSNL